MERLAREIEEEIGVTVVYLTVNLEGDPGWEYPEGRPAVAAAPKLTMAWEKGAGRVKPKAPPRPKVLSPDDIIIEANLEKDPRPYNIREVYEPGDRIEHPTLGDGVVQRPQGPGKISVLFDEEKKLLIHARP